jgi:chaperonin GroES
MADVKLKPLADRVLIEPKEAETKTASGIFIPTQRGRNLSKVKLLLLAPVLKTKKWKLKSAILSCTVSIQEQKSPLMVKII